MASYRFGYELRSWTFNGEVVSLRVKPSRDGEDKVRFLPNPELGLGVPADTWA